MRPLTDSQRRGIARHIARASPVEPSGHASRLVVLVLLAVLGVAALVVLG